LTGHQRWVSSVAFSPDGQRIVSGGGDGSIRLWETATGKPIGEAFLVPQGNVDSVAFSPDGRRIVSGGEDGYVRLWPAPSADSAAWRETLCDKLTANMSHEQWNDWVSPDIDYIKACPDLPIAPD
jgi:WD40 repeat protein